MLLEMAVGTSFIAIAVGTALLIYHLTNISVCCRKDTDHKLMRMETRLKEYNLRTYHSILIFVKLLKKYFDNNIK